MNSKSEYIERINNASPLQLTIINYELLLAHLAAAIDCAPKSDVCDAALNGVKACVAELHATLNMDVEFSQDLEGIYLYINRLAIHASMKRDLDEKNALLKEAAGLAEGLLEAWRQLETQESTPKAPAPQVFAGLTYGRDGQLSEYHDFDPGKGLLDKKS